MSLPLLFVADAVVGPRLRTTALEFLDSGLVRPEDAPRVDAAIDKVRRRRESWIPELIILAISFFTAWNLSVESLHGSAGTSWNSRTTADGSPSATGLWYFFISVPLLQFIFFRWLWRLAIWTLFLGDLRRLGLNLVPTHADRAAGVEFLGNAHVTLSIFGFALGCILSADTAFRVRFEGADIKSSGPALGLYVAATLILSLGPLALFGPTMISARLRALREYGRLVNAYNLEFQQKWVKGPPPSEKLLGNQDIQSLADLGNSYDRIRDMGTFPFDRGHVVRIAVVTALPALPLVFLVMPVADLLKLIGRALL